MKFRYLTHENFLMYAIKNYENPVCTSAEEFKKDMKLFSYISKFLNRASDTSPPKYRLLLNHIITLRNLFGAIPTARMLFFYFPEKHHPTLATALDFLGVFPLPAGGVIPEMSSETARDVKFQEFLKAI